MGLSNVSYHFAILNGAGIVELARTGQVRGSTAHFYSSAVSRNRKVRPILAATWKEDQQVRKSPQGGGPGRIPEKAADRLARSDRRALAMFTRPVVP